MYRVAKPHSIEKRLDKLAARLSPTPTGFFRRRQAAGSSVVAVASSGSRSDNTPEASAQGHNTGVLV
jgi:hypothetical protein